MRSTQTKHTNKAHKPGRKKGERHTGGEDKERKEGQGSSGRKKEKEKEQEGQERARSKQPQRKHPDTST